MLSERSVSEGVECRVSGVECRVECWMGCRHATSDTRHTIRFLRSCLGIIMIPLLFITTICSFLFYGVVGQDKTWVLAPLFVLNYGLVAAVLLRKAFGSRFQVVGGGGDPASARRGLAGKLPTLVLRSLGEAGTNSLTTGTRRRRGSLFVGVERFADLQSALQAAGFNHNAK